MDDHTILSNDPNFGNISVCPGGVVHINLRHLTLKFVPSDFDKLSDLVAQARLSIDKRSPRPDGKPRLQLVSKTDEEDPDSSDS